LIVDNGKKGRVANLKRENTTLPFRQTTLVRLVTLRSYSYGDLALVNQT